MGKLIFCLLLFFCVLIYAGNVKADVFCEGNFTGTLYYPNGNYNQIPATSGTCRWVRIGNAPNGTNCAFLTSSGNYSLQNCPIDDYVWFLIFPIGFLSFYHMRNRIQCQLFGA